MKKLLFALAFASLTLLFCQTAKIKIDIDRAISEIDPKIYGVFMNPIHFNGRRLGLPDSVEFNTLYGNLYDPSSPFADENGFRKDYIDAMKERKVNQHAMAGGNFLMGYNWQDGIGPKEQHPTRTFAGKAEASLINAASLNDPFTFDKRDQYMPVSQEVKIKNDRLSYTFPPHSFTQIKVEVKGK